MLSRASGAKADILLDDMQSISWAGGKRSLKVLATPGHTNGCVLYHDADVGLVFTGDTLLIDGCGRYEARPNALLVARISCRARAAADVFRAR